ncbi:MAG: hypothetical protein P8177_05255 [Gemmatimonadota bacterium]
MFQSVIRVMYPHSMRNTPGTRMSVATASTAYAVPTSQATRMVALRSCRRPRMSMQNWYMAGTMKGTPR